MRRAEPPESSRRHRSGYRILLLSFSTLPPPICPRKIARGTRGATANVKTTLHTPHLPPSLSPSPSTSTCPPPNANTILLQVSSPPEGVQNNKRPSPAGVRGCQDPRPALRERFHTAWRSEDKRIRRCNCRKFLTFRRAWLLCEFWPSA